MYKDFYIEFWKNDVWSDMRLSKLGSEVEMIIKQCKKREESIRIRRMNVESEQLEITYSFISDNDRKSYCEYSKKQQQNKVALKQKPVESLTDKQAQAMLDRLTNHFGYPVRPVYQYCDALNEWAHQISALNQAAGDDSSRHGSEYYLHLRNIMIDIRKSNLLWRLIYVGEKVRTEPCPIHNKKWSGINLDGCFYGCGETGWLPN